jgi:hypothetical protein
MIKNTQMKNHVLPLDKTVPVAVNMFYGDPLLQIENTVSWLDKLEANGHTGVVLIVTKGDYSLFPKKKWKLNLHIAFSTFGKDSDMDGGSFENFKNNVKICGEYPHKHSIEYRPIIKDINDDVREVMELAKEYNIPVAYGGLIENNKHVEEKTIKDIESYGVDTYRKTLYLLNNYKC